VSEEEVDCVRLDDWAAQTGVKGLGLIKLDVEGAEIPVLQGAEKLIARFQPLLITEYNPACAVKYFGASETAYYDLLSDVFPFRYLIHDGGHLTRLDRRETLLEALQRGKGWEDLLCSFHSLA